MTTWYMLSLTLHLFGLALWLGGIVFFLVVFGPAVNELRPSVGIHALNQGRISLEIVSWVAIGPLFLSGMLNLILRIQTIGVPPGQFYLMALSLKLLLFLAMLVHHCLQVFRYAPEIASLTAVVSGESPSWPEPLRALWQRWFTLLKINATLGPIVTLLGLFLIKS
jgi:putative copper export protein